MMELLRKISPLRVAPNSPETDEMLGIIGKELPFEVHEYPAGKEHNGWVVPQQWFVKKAEIKKGGKVVYDGLKHPLGVIGYSEPFKGKVALKELKEHVFVHPALDDALVYHCDLFYKVGQKNWGFSMPRKMRDSLKDGEYDVDLEVHKSGGTMKVADFFLKGDSEKTVVLNAHNCHAGQAEDDMTGVVVGIEVMRRLAKLPKRKYSYRLVVAPEHLGTVFYLAGLPEKTVKALWCGIFLEMLGNPNGFAFQKSFNGNALIDRAAHNYLLHHHSNDKRIMRCPREKEREQAGVDGGKEGKNLAGAKEEGNVGGGKEAERVCGKTHEGNAGGKKEEWGVGGLETERGATKCACGFYEDDFRRVVGNDETVWEAAGYEIPFISLSRWPYAEYHSSRDTPEIISGQKLEEAVKTVLGVIEILEKDCMMRRKFRGLVALSNPKYCLYIGNTDPSLRPRVPIDQKNWNYMMDCLPRYFDGKATLLEVAEKHGLPFGPLCEYVGKFREKGLVDLVETE